MLLIYDGQCAPDASTIRMGGIPLVPVGFEWPTCRTCDGAMQFLAHLPLEVGVISVFFCQNDPGMCADWDATSGGNCAYLFLDALEPAAVPTEGVTLLGAATGLSRHPEHAPRKRGYSAASAASPTGFRTTRLRCARGATLPWHSPLSSKKVTITEPRRTLADAAGATSSTVITAVGQHFCGSADRLAYITDYAVGFAVGRPFALTGLAPRLRGGRVRGVGRGSRRGLAPGPAGVLGLRHGAAFSCVRSAR